MKSFAVGLLLLLSSLALQAQVTVEVRLEQDQFLPGETLTAIVRVTNRSGRTLHLGEEEDWLTFSLENQQGSVVEKIGEAPVKGDFDLDNAKTAIKRVDLAPYFGLALPGRYSIVATVKIKEWDHLINSPPKGFYIIEGAKLWEQAFGLPKGSSTNRSPEVRRYVLQQANYLKGQLRLYLRLTDEAGTKTLRVFPIGQLVSFSRPDPQVDKVSNLHVLYANGPHSYSYSVFNPEGELLTRDVYDYVGTRPRLQPYEDGNIKVVGGVRRTTTASAPEEPEAAAPPPKP